MNNQVFQAEIEHTLFGDLITPAQTVGIFEIASRFSRQENQDDRHLAYMLATTYHETGRRMVPIKEKGGDQYLRKRYDVEGTNPERARRYGNHVPGDGILYAGRGFVQLTWRANYARVGAFIEQDLVNFPDLCLELGIATEILVRGMTDGWFTGRRLADYFSDAKEDWHNARRIINGIDRAEWVAGYGRLF